MADFFPREDFYITPNDVSLVIPTLNASKELPKLLDCIDSQTFRPSEVLIIDSSSDDDTVNIAENHSGVRVESINRESFNHGLTRHHALLSTKGKFVCFLTQDAIPATNGYFENLLALFADPDVALVSGRQLPKPDARRFEQLVREYNYCSNSNIRSAADISRYGIKTFFATDVCSAYRRDSYLKMGGFPSLNMSEDMYMAAKFINAGLKIAYAAEARVFHSHNLTPKEQYARNKAIGVFLESNRQLLGEGGDLNEGVRLVRYVSTSLLREAKPFELAAFALDCAARIAGNRVGRYLVRSR